MIPNSKVLSYEYKIADKYTISVHLLVNTLLNNHNHIHHTGIL